MSTYIAESIIDARGDADNRDYLIHWRSFPNKFDTWESDENVKDRSMVAQADRRWLPPPRAEKAPVPPMETNPLRPEEIEEVDDVRNACSGLAVSFKLKGTRKVTAHIPLLSLSVEVHNMPVLQRALCNTGF